MNETPIPGGAPAEHIASGGIVQMPKKLPLVGEKGEGIIPHHVAERMQRNVQAMVPVPVKLAPAEAAALMATDRKAQAVQTWVQMVSEQGEQRLQALIQEKQKAMLDIAKAYGLDLERVAWAFDAQTGSLVPQQMRFR